jgi:hypothetical protein
MSEQINRWDHGASFEHAFDCDAGMYASAEGAYVTYADHVEALRACEARVTAAAVQRVQALPWTSDTWLAHAERAAIIAAIKGDQP